MKTKTKINSHLLLLVFSIFLSSISCKEDPLIPKPQTKLTLTLEDISCTEAWLNLKLENVSLPINLELKSDTSILKTYSYTNSIDTVLYVDSLLPNQTYNLQLTNIPQSCGLYRISSSQLSVNTDTTSDNFTRQNWMFNEEVGSCTFYDAVILNENSFWIVGNIKIRDRVKNDSILNNETHWDGNDWTLHRIMFYNICGQHHQNARATSSILAFSESDVGIGWAGSYIAKLNEPTQVDTY